MLILVIGMLLFSTPSIVSGDWWEEVWEETKEKAEEWWRESEEISEWVAGDIENYATEWAKDVQTRASGIKRLWTELPDEATDLIVKKTESETLVIVPYTDEYSVGRGRSKREPGFKFTVVKISPLEGKIMVYEPSKRQFRTLLTDAAISKITGGWAQVDDVEDLSISRVGESDYKVKVKTKGRLLWIIPWTIKGEGIVDVETGKVREINQKTPPGMMIG